MDINNHKQSAGDNSNQIIAHTVNQHYGIQIADVVPIVHGLVKSELETYQKVADIKAQTRFEEFTKSLESEIETKVADKVNKFSEPSMQYAAREATLGYIKTGDSEQKDILIDFLIQRINSEERSSIQLLIDESIKILPKLSSKCIAVLTLMTYSKLKVTWKKSVLEAAILKLNPIIDRVYDVKNIDLEYLEQTGCITSTIGFKNNENWLQENQKNYPLFFCHLNNEESTDRFFSKYGFIKEENRLVISGGVSPQEFGNFVSCFDLTVEGKVSPSLLTVENYLQIVDSFRLFAKEDILSLLEKRTPMSDTEIMDYYANINPRWVQTVEVLDGKMSQYSLNLVGKYIGSIHLTKLLETPISLELLIPN